MSEEEEEQIKIAKETCMCGDYMNDHSMLDNHTPLSMYDYYYRDGFVRDLFNFEFNSEKA